MAGVFRPSFFRPPPPSQAAALGVLSSGYIPVDTPVTINVSVANAATLKRETNHRIVIYSGHSIADNAPIISVGKFINVAMTNVATLRGAVSKFINATIANLVSLVAVSDAGSETNKTINVPVSNAASLLRSTSKLVQIAQSSLTTLARITSAFKTISITNNQSVNIVRSIAKRVLASIGQTVTTARIAAAGKIISVTNGQTVTLLRSVSKIILIATGQIVTSIRDISKTIYVSIANFTSAGGLPNLFDKIISVASASATSLGRSKYNPKNISVLIGSLLEWNPNDIDSDGAVSISSDGYTASETLSGFLGRTRSLTGKDTGKWFFETTFSGPAFTYLIGFVQTGWDLQDNLGSLPLSVTYGMEAGGSGKILYDSGSNTFITTPGNGDIIGFAVDTDANEFSVSLNGLWFNFVTEEFDLAAPTSMQAYTASGKSYPVINLETSNEPTPVSCTINIDPVYAIPSGYSLWINPSLDVSLTPTNIRSKIITITRAMTARLINSIGKSITVVATAIVTTLQPFIYRAQALLVAMPHAASVITQAAKGKLVSISMASVVTLRRNMEKNITIARSLLTTLRRNINKLISMIVITPVIVAAKNLAKLISIAIAPIATLSNLKAFGKIIPTIQIGRVVTLMREAGKVIKPVVGQTTTMRRAMGKLVNVSVTNTITLIKRTNSRIIVAITNTTSLIAVKQYYRTLTVQLSNTTSLVRDIGKRIVVSQFNLIRVTRAQFVTINVTLGNAVTNLRFNTRQQILNIIQANNVSQSASLAKIIYAYVGNVVDVIRRIIRDITGATEPALIRSGNNVFLVTVTGHDGATVQTLRFSTEGILTRPSDTPASTYFDPRVIDPGNFERHIRARGVQGGSVGTGDVLLASGTPGRFSSTLDYLLDWAFDGYTITIQSLTSVRQAVSLATTLFVGTIEQLLTADAYNKIGFKIHDRLSDIEHPFLTDTYAGTTTSGGGGTANGNVDLKGKKKQRIYGTVYNAPPQISNPFDLVLDFSDGPVSSIVLYDGALALTNDGDVADLAALLAWTKVPGEYKTCLALGKVRAGGLSVFGWQADVVEGNSSPAGQRTAAQILLRMFNDYGISSGDLEAATFTALDTYNSSECGIIIQDDETFLSAARRLLDGPGADVLPTRLGKFGVWYFAAPSTSPDATVVELEEDTIIGSSLQRIATESTGRGIPIYRVTMRYAHNETVLNTTQISGSVSEARRAFVEAEYRSIVAEDLSVLDRHLKAIEVTFDTCFISEADAEAEAERHLALFSVRRDAYRVKAMLDYADVAQIGTVVSLKAPRFGLDSGQKFIVIGRVDDYENKTVDLDLWG